MSTTAHNARQPDRAEAFHRVTDVLRCKWTLAVLNELRGNTRRPSEIQRALPGLSQKVLNERLRKLETFGLIDRQAFAEVPPRVEYALNERGKNLAEIVREVSEFIDDWAGPQTAAHNSSVSELPPTA